MIYFIVALYIFFLYFIYSISLNNKKVIFLMASIPFVALFAIRGVKVGGDTLTYVNEFFNRDYLDREIGYVLFCEIIRFFGRTPFVYIFFTSLISLIPFLLLIKVFGNRNPLSILYVFLFSVLVICIETNIRQNIGTGLVMLSLFVYTKIKQKGIKYYIIPLLLLVWGTLCHASLYFMVPLCILIYFIKINRSISVVLIIVAFVVGGLTTTLVENVLSYFYYYSEGVEGLAKLNSYSQGTYLGNYSEATFSIGRILTTSWALLIIFTCDKEEISNFFIKCLVFYIIIYNLANASDLMYRMIYTLQLFSIVYIPKRFEKQEYRLVLLFFILVWMRKLYQLCTTPSMQNPDAMMFPYVTI